MTRFPLRYAHQNILVGEGDARAALFRVDTVSYPFLAAADKREWLRRLARFAFAVEADFSLWRVCREYPADGYADQAMALLDDRGQSPAAWRSYLNGHEAHLRELRSFTPEVYLAVALPRRSARPASIGCAGASRASSASRIRCRSRRRRSTPWSPPRSARSAAPRRRLPVRRATTRELQWLLRRAACRGVAEPALDDHWEPAALIVETADGQPAYEPLGTDIVRHANAPVLEQDRALVVDAEEGRCIQAMLGMGALPEESEFPGGAELLFSPLEALPFPVDAVVHARWLGNREAITRVRRRIVDADVAFSEQLNSTHGPLSYAAEENRQLARELDAYLQSHERPPLLNVAISLAVGAPSRRRARAARRGARAPLRDGRAAPPARAAAGAVPRSPAARGRRHGARLRRRADDRAVRCADAGRHAPGRLGPRRLHRPHAGRRRAAGALRRHRGVADGAAAVDPARRHARLGQDDRRRAARLPGRAPRLARRRRRPEARPQPRGAARARRPRARDRALRRRPLPRPARPARRRARVAARGPRQLVPDRAAAAGAAAWETQVRKAVRARVGVAGAELPAGARPLARLGRSGRSRRRRGAVGVGRLGRRPARVRRRRARPRRGAAAGDDDQGPRAVAAGAGDRARGLRPGRAARRGHAEADRRLRDAARRRRPFGAQGRALRRGLVPARLARRPPPDRPAEPAGARGERDADPGHAAADRRRRDREPDRHALHLRPGDRRRSAPRARSCSASIPRTARWSSGSAPTGAGVA